MHDCYLFIFISGNVCNHTSKKRIFFWNVSLVTLKCSVSPSFHGLFGWCVSSCRVFSRDEREDDDEDDGMNRVYCIHRRKHLPDLENSLGLGRIEGGNSHCETHSSTPSEYMGSSSFGLARFHEPINNFDRFPLRWRCCCCSADDDDVGRHGRICFFLRVVVGKREENAGAREMGVGEHDCTLSKPERAKA